jgi:hypothetical protein
MNRLLVSGEVDCSGKDRFGLTKALLKSLVYGVLYYRYKIWECRGFLNHLCAFSGLRAERRDGLPQSRLVCIMLALCLVLGGCGQQATTQETSPIDESTLSQTAMYPGTEWEWAPSPERLGWSSAKLAGARLYSERIGSAVVMIIVDGVVVDAWGDLERKYHCHSVRKSFLSALFGIYVADGRIDLTQSLRDLGIDDHTPLTAIEKTAIVTDLLSARSGVYIEAAGETPLMKRTRPARGSHKPGTFWYYNNWDFNALGSIFDHLSGEKNIYTAFDKRIADPIGMQDFDPEELSYSYAPYSSHPYYGFRMSARDLARFGLLFLRNGHWWAEGNPGKLGA